MKQRIKWLPLGALALVMSFGAVGCQNSTESAKEDASKAGKAIQTGLREAEQATEKAAKNASAALSLTPKVKNAIIADKQLNNPRNLIDVDSADNVVHLRGHVYSAALKNRAGEIAKRVLQEVHATDKLSNELQVNPNAKPSGTGAAEKKMKNAAKNAGAALTLTPKIKSAITADKQLNDHRNHIDVDSANNVVHLKGHVYSAALKQRAGEIAKRVLQQNKATDKLSNELQVKA